MITRFALPFILKAFTVAKPSKNLKPTEQTAA